MDAHRYDEWLSLWAEDATYWVPCNDDDIDPIGARTVSIILLDRRGQLKGPNPLRMKETGRLLREQAPRLKRVSIQYRSRKKAGESELVVNSSFILAELHHHQQYLWAGSTTTRTKLVGDGDQLKIKYQESSF